MMCRPIARGRPLDRLAVGYDTGPCAGLLLFHFYANASHADIPEVQCWRAGLNHSVERQTAHKAQCHCGCGELWALAMASFDWISDIITAKSGDQR